MNVYQLKDMCLSCHNNFTHNYCVNCNTPCCISCCETFLHYKSKYIHICYTCFNHINSKIIKYNDKFHDEYFQNKYNQKLKKITLKKLNLKMLLNSQKTI